MNVLSCSNLSKFFITVEIFSGVSFHAEKGDRIGLIGANGAGKTTLFNVLTGRLSKDSGDIFIPKGISIGYQEQQVTVEGDETVYESVEAIFADIIQMGQRLQDLTNQMASETGDQLEKTMETYQRLLDTYEAQNGYGYQSAIRGVLTGMGFTEEDGDRPLRSLSGGQKSRLELSKLLLRSPDILFLDEPTNHLDMDAIAFLENFLSTYSGTVFLISHDRYFLDRVCNRIFLLENQKLETYNTNYSQYVVRRKQDLEIRMRAYENQQKAILREEAIIERYAATDHAAKNVAAKSRQKRLDKLERLDKPQGQGPKVHMRFTPALESGTDVIQVRGIEMGFGQEAIFENVDFDLYKGDKVGLIGPNGVGKTTLFRLLMGKYMPLAGQIDIGHNVLFGYYDQEQSGLNLDKTVRDELWDAFPHLDYQEVRGYLARFMFYGEAIDRLVGELSGGERGRLALLKLMLGDANTLLMDEPTNHLDIDSKEILEDALVDYDGTLLVISHDRYFLNRVCDKLFVLSSKGMETYLGNYDYYQMKLKEAQEEDDPVQTVTRTQIQKEKKKAGMALKVLRQKRADLRNLETDLEAIQTELDELTEKSYDPDIYQDPDQAKALFAQISKVRERKEETEEAWFELSEELEGEAE